MHFARAPRLGLRRGAFGSLPALEDVFNDEVDGYKAHGWPEKLHAAPILLDSSSTWNTYRRSADDGLKKSGYGALSAAN